MLPKSVGGLVLYLGIAFLLYFLTYGNIIDWSQPFIYIFLAFWWVFLIVWFVKWFFILGVLALIIAFLFVAFA